jgi:hypothetical protein
MVGEALAGLSAFKTVFDILSALKGMDDAAKRNAAVYDLWEKVTTVQQRYTAAIEQVETLKAELARFETWEAEKEKYELKPTGTGGLVFMLKPAERGTTTPHWLCPNCYEQRKKSYFTAPAAGMFICTTCKTAFRFHGQPRWLD